MKRLLLGIISAVFIVVGIQGGNARAAAQSTNNFVISSFEANYYLDEDSEGRSTLKTVEKITAVFPVYDQNHGLERALPEKYDGHSTGLKLESVVDENGTKSPYSTSTLNDNLVLRIGDADTYVHGPTTYVITYTQRDVTKFFGDTNDDEFYWDVNGTQWSQQMEKVSANVYVTPVIAEKLNQNTSCYRGIEGSTDQCELKGLKENGRMSFTALAANLGPHENMTVAIGFNAHTFTPYQATLAEKVWSTVVSIWLILLVVGSILAIIAIIWMLVERHHIMSRVKGRGTIIPEYLPPRDASVLISSQVLSNSTSDMTGEIIDLAVRHYLKIYQTKDKTLFKPAEYELEIIKDTSDLHSEEIELLKNFFGGSYKTVGSRFAMKKLQNNTTLAKKLVESRKTLRTDARGKYALFEYAKKEAKQFRTIGFIMLAIGVLMVSPLVILAAIIAFIIAHTLWPLTEKGVILRDYLLGLKEYITVAEEDRIKMLQSPEGAEKVGAKLGENDTAQLVKLYERVLPYAVLFGVEKQWSKQLGAYYEQGSSQPDWYAGNTAFNAAVFSSSLSSFSSQSSSYSSSSSSSSGGSSGGGSSGGGGGGGGGGGW